MLTKPLGTGVVTTAIKREIVDPQHLAAAVRSMMRLNRIASHASQRAGVRAATDITGFGLLGHALEMSDAAEVRFRVRFEDLPWLPGALGYAEQWVFAGGAFNNQAFYRPLVTFSHALTDWQEVLLHDPQTSGGLLAAVPQAALPAFEAYCAEHEQSIWVIGEVVEGEGIEIV